MRKTAMFFAPAVLVGFVFACEQDPNADPPRIVIPEAGTFDVIPPPDVNVPDTTIQSVSVLVLGHSGPVAGIRVVAHDAQGAPIGSSMTGADGRTTITGATPAMVSALLADPRNFNRSIVTWVGVEAGDTLVVNQFLEDDNEIGHLDVSLTDSPGGIIDHRVSLGGSCSVNAVNAPFTLPLFRSCVRPANNSLLVAYYNDIPAVEAYAFKKMVAAPANDAGAPHTASAFAIAEDFTISAENYPGAINARASLAEVSGLSIIENDSDNVGFGDLGNGGQPRVAPYKKAPGFADALVVSARTPTITAGANAIVGERFAPAGVTTKNIDLATRLPEITEVTLNVATPRRPVIAWTPASSLEGAGAMGGVVTIGHRGIDEFYEWHFVVPPGATTVTGPAFGAEADPWLPAADAGPGVFTNPSAGFYAASAIPAPSAFRQGAAGALGGPRNALNVFVAAANGTFKVSEFRFGR